MSVPTDFLVSALVTLLVVVDPIGLTPAFIGLTEGLPRTARRQVALRASLIAFAILTGAALIGDWLLRALAISLPAFRIAGGLLLFSIAAKWCSACASRASPKPPARPSRSMCATSRRFRWPSR